MKYLYLFIFIILFSCINEKKCIDKYIDTTYIQEYSVVNDTCDSSKNVNYFINDVLIMAGKGNWIYKQGNWIYYNNKDIVTEGSFENSNPIGKWKYKNFGEINWVVLDGEGLNFKIAIPDNWVFIKNNNTVAIFNSSNLQEHDLKISVTVIEYKDPIKNWVENIIKDLKEEEKFFDIKSKKIKYEGFNEVYEIEYLAKFEGYGNYRSRDLIYKTKNKIYVLNSNFNVESNFAYWIIKDQIINSFKIIINDEY